MRSANCVTRVHFYRRSPVHLLVSTVECVMARAGQTAQQENVRQLRKTNCPHAAHTHSPEKFRLIEKLPFRYGGDARNMRSRMGVPLPLPMNNAFCARLHMAVAERAIIISHVMFGAWPMPIKRFSVYLLFVIRIRVDAPPGGIWGVQRSDRWSGQGITHRLCLRRLHLALISWAREYVISAGRRTARARAAAANWVNDHHAYPITRLEVLFVSLFIVCSKCFCCLHFSPSLMTHPHPHYCREKNAFH